MGGGEEKTENATPKKRRDERSKGHVMMSRDAVTVVSLFGAIWILRISIGNAARMLGDFLRYCMMMAQDGETSIITKSTLFHAAAMVARICGPMLAVAILTATVATMAQTRMLVTFQPLKPSFSKLNPLNGVKRLFSLKSLVMTGMNLVKIILLMVIVYQANRNLLAVAERYMYAELTGSIRHLFQSIMSMLTRVAMAFLVLAGVDYLYQHWDFEKNMKMTKQEVKEEYKQTEGDPQIKGKIKSLQREMARSRMMGQVPKSDVVIRNPTHVAVALRYHAGEDEAPVILAMGIDELALRIVHVAEENGVTVIENVALARAIYAVGELNRPIPPDLYEAVAEVMVYLYKLGKLTA